MSLRCRVSIAPIRVRTPWNSFDLDSGQSMTRMNTTVALLMASALVAAACTNEPAADTDTTTTTITETTTTVAETTTTTTAVSEPEPTTTTEPSVTTTTAVLLPGPAPKITFLFDPNVPLDVQDRVRQEVPLVNAFFARVLGRQVLEVVWIMSDSEEWVVDTWKEYFGTQAKTGFGTLPNAVLAPTGWSTSEIIAHELFHLLEMQLAGAESANDCQSCGQGGVEPIWLHEGAATYYGLQYASDPGGAYFGDPSVLRSMETRQEFNASNQPGTLPVAAVDFLISNFGESSVVAFYESLQVYGELNAREAFEGTFGMSLEDFYGEFEESMSSVTP